MREKQVHINTANTTLYGMLPRDVSCSCILVDIDEKHWKEKQRNHHGAVKKSSLEQQFHKLDAVNHC